MSSLPLRQLAKADFPVLLHEIPQPPKELWAEGNLPPSDLKLLTVVGSRKYTTYGKQVVEQLIAGLAHHPIGIVSGLALGIDTLAHEAALQHNLYTLAVPGSGLHPDSLYPATNRRLAARIVASGGGLLSELPPDSKAAKWTFPARNRLMAGLSPATLLIEAEEKSGTLITARMVTDYNRELLVVPGSIFSSTSRGVHQFLKLGATPIMTAEDILEALHLETSHQSNESLPPTNLSPTTIHILSHLREPVDRDSLIRQLAVPVNEANIMLMQAELEGHISAEGGIYTAVTYLANDHITPRSP